MLQVVTDNFSSSVTQKSRLQTGFQGFVTDVTDNFYIYNFLYITIRQLSIKFQN